MRQGSVHIHPLVERKDEEDLRSVIKTENSSQDAINILLQFMNQSIEPHSMWNDWHGNEEKTARKMKIIIEDYNFVAS